MIFWWPIHTNYTRLNRMQKNIKHTLKGVKCALSKCSGIKWEIRMVVDEQHEKVMQLLIKTHTDNIYIRINKVKRCSPLSSCFIKMLFDFNHFSLCEDYSWVLKNFELLKILHLSLVFRHVGLTVFLLIILPYIDSKANGFYKRVRSCEYSSYGEYYSMFALTAPMWTL